LSAREVSRLPSGLQPGGPNSQPRACCGARRLDSPAGIALDRQSSQEDSIEDVESRRRQTDAECEDDRRAGKEAG